MGDIKNISYDFSTKEEMLANLRNYMVSPDDDTIRLKEEIKARLLKCPQLLWALNADEDKAAELFDEEGNLNEDGEWDIYFGENSYIRPFLFIPQTQDTVTNYLCYQVSTEENMRYKDDMKYVVITFTIFVHAKNTIDKETGIQRHDLIGSILREIMSWSSITMASAVPIYENEGVTDNNYVSKVLKYQAAMPNNLVVTKNGITSYRYKDKG